jgi:two-component system, NarL family, sensor histidine kinase UhpB
MAPVGRCYSRESSGNIPDPSPVDSWRMHIVELASQDGDIGRRARPLSVPEPIAPILAQPWVPVMRHLQLTLKLRVCLIITALLVLLTIADGIYVISKARDDVRDEVRSTLVLTGHFLDAQLDVLRDRWASQGYVVPLFQLRELQDIRHVIVRFYDSHGNLLDTNEDTTDRRPTAPRWFTTLVHLTSLPAATETRAVSFNGATVGQLVMSPDPTYEIEEMWSTSRGLLALLLVFFVVVNTVVWWSVSRALRPVDQILQALERVREGDLAVRLPGFSLPELSSVGVGFNHMAETLERSVSENQRLTRELLNAQEKERRHLAHELHDEIAQCVSAIHADAVAIRSRGGQAVQESAEAIVQVVAELKERVRSMLRRIRPAYLEGLGLEAGLREQIAAFRQRYPRVACSLDVQGDLALLDEEVGVAVYRVVQESLTNTAVHANARAVLVRLKVPDPAQDAAPNEHAHHSVRLTVQDDGAGFFQLTANRGLGLTGIRERTRALGGSCSIVSEPGQGTRIDVTLPYTPKQEAVDA